MCLQACETLQLVTYLLPLSHLHVFRLKTEVAIEYVTDQCHSFHHSNFFIPKGKICKKCLSGETESVKSNSLDDLLEVPK